MVLFYMFWIIPTGKFAVKFSVKLLLANMGFVVPRFSEQKSSFLEVLYRSSCSLINAVIKYLNFHTSTSKLGSKLCVCVQRFFCVFKVICVCSKLIVNSKVLGFLRSCWYFYWLILTSLSHGFGLVSLSEKSFGSLISRRS